MLHYTLKTDLLLEGKFDEAVLREFNQKDTAFEHLREMGLELTSRVLALEVGRGKAHIFSVVTGRKKMTCRFSHACVITVLPVQAVSVLCGTNN